MNETDQPRAASDGLSGVVIRPMQLDDLAEVAAIDTASFSLPWPERSFRFELQENQASRSWVAQTTGPDGQMHIAGILVLWLIVDEAHIGTIAVHPDDRQKGIGQKLLATALYHAALGGMLHVFLEVRRSNEAAQAMYRKFGFEEVGVRKRYYRDTGEDAILMNLDHLLPEPMLALAGEKNT